MPRIGVQLANGRERLVRQPARLGKIAAFKRDLRQKKQIETNLARSSPEL